MDPKQLARQISLRTLEAVAPSAAVERCLTISGDTLYCSGQEFDLRCYPDLRVLAVGKAAHGMLEGLLALLPHREKLAGVVSAPIASRKPRSGFRYFAGGHPEPN